jgi:hypothetical protein
MHYARCSAAGVDALGLGGRRSRRAGSKLLTAIGPLALLGLFVASPANAQNAASGEFSVQRFDPAPGPRNFFTTRTLRTDGQMAWSAGLFLNYSSDPFVIASCKTQSDCSGASNVPGHSQDVHVVRNLATANLLGTLTPIERLQIGLDIPVSYVNGDGFTQQGLPNYDNPIRTAGLGDPLIEAKVRAIGTLKDPVVVGGAAFVTAPLGHATAKGDYIGDDTPSGGLRGIVDGKAGPYAFAANLVAAFRGNARVGSTTLGSEFRYSVAAGFQASPLVRVLLDGFGSTKFSSEDGTNTFELDGGGQITPLNSPISVMVGVGAGIIQGIGVPKIRGLAGLMYTAESRDRDGDGIPDNQDQCPTEAEDKDGFEDQDGCPDPDNDGDGIRDSDDKCPNQPEDMDGFQDTDGCPDPDNDNDGVDDAHDQCPDKPETKNGYKDDDGCPDEPDRDGDGVPDSKDKCPDQPEDTDGFQDTDGCPDPDNDNDGIKDEDDECVDEPETKNGYQDEDGCPDTPGQKAPPPKKKKK